MKLKKVAALGLATAMAFSVTACSSSKPAETTAAAEEAETTAAADGEAVKEAVEGKDPAEVTDLVHLLGLVILTIHDGDVLCL